MVRKSQDPDSKQEDSIQTTRVDASYFEHPAKRLGVSGGTAPFFALQLTEKGVQHYASRYGSSTTTTDDDNGDGTTSTLSTRYFIGKDLSRAIDEVEFYEKSLRILSSSSSSDDGDNDDDGGLTDLMRFTFDYAGVVTLPELVNDKPINRELLVLRNLYDEHSKLRLLDFKMGEKTADANWRGKSRLRAMKQAVLDGFTNSTVEGFRLEGFDGEPEVVASMDPLLDFHKMSLSSRSRPTTPKNKKAERMAFQKMTGFDTIMHYVDLTDQTLPPSATEKTHWSQTEVAETVLHETLSRLVRLSRVCHGVTVPQKWLGSSVALGYDCGFFPPRDTTGRSESLIRSKVIVNAFDWGRSELRTTSDVLSATEQADREAFWKLYKSGMDNLSFAVTRRYYNQFSNCIGWSSVTIRVMDYDSASADDFIGEITVPLPDPSTGVCDGTEPVLNGEFALRNKGKPLLVDGSAGGKRGSLNLVIQWWEAPKPERKEEEEQEQQQQPRVLGAWRITIDRAQNLKKMDYLSSDPYCLVIARSEDSTFEFEQMTSVVTKNCNPAWNQTLEVPVVSNGSVLVNTLRSTGLEVDSKKLRELFGGGSVDSQNSEWKKLLSE